MEKLERFPISGFCETTDSRLIKYLNKKSYTPPSRSFTSDIIGIAWNLSSYWWVSGCSAKTEYSFEEILPFLPNETDSLIGRYMKVIKENSSGAKIGEYYKVNEEDENYFSIIINQRKHVFSKISKYSTFLLMPPDFIPPTEVIFTSNTDNILIYKNNSGYIAATDCYKDISKIQKTNGLIKIKTRIPKLSTSLVKKTKLKIIKYKII